MIKGQIFDKFSMVRILKFLHDEFSEHFQQVKGLGKFREPFC